MIPDIETDALLVQKDGERSWIRLQPSAHKRREADYEWHLEHPSARHGEKPMETVSYLFLPKPNEKASPRRRRRDGRGRRRSGATRDDENQKTDFLMDFARDFLVQAKTSKRRELVQQSKAFLDKVRGRRGQEGLAGAREAGRRLDAPGRPPAPTRAAADAADGGARGAKIRGRHRRPRCAAWSRTSARAGLPRARRARERQPDLRRERDGVRQDRARRIEELRAVGQGADLVVHAHRRAQGDALHASAG